MNKYLSIIGLVGIALVTYFIFSPKESKIINRSELIEVNDTTYWKKDMTLFTGKAIGQYQITTPAEVSEFTVGTKARINNYILEAEYINGVLNGDYIRLDTSAYSREVRRVGLRATYHNGDSLRATYINGKIEGILKEWYDNNQLKEESYFKNGKKHGPSKEWWKNGQLKNQTSFINGLANGIFKNWYDNGQLWTEGFVKNDTIDGIYTTYRKNGIKQFEQQFKNDIEILFQQYDENGKLISEYEKYPDGTKKRIMRRNLNGNGSAIHTYYHKNGEVNYIYYFDKKGNRISEGQYYKLN